MNILNRPVSEITEKIRSGEISCLEIVQSTFKTIAEKNPVINAFLTVLPEQATARAKQLDRLSMEEKAKLPLLGIPVAIKDNLCTDGIPTTCSSKMLENFIPPYSATVVEALENAGAIVVGKTNLDEFAMGSSTENSAFTVTRNPWNTAHIAGGSSGGSAAAVASGMVSVALGSDTGGSIRQPSSHCGVCGLKPTYGRVSRYGLVAFASSLDQIGPICNDVRDVGHVLSIISQPDNRDSTYSRKPFVNDPALYRESLEHITVGIPKEYFEEGISAGVRCAIENLIQKLKGVKARFVGVSLPNIKYAIATYYIVCTAEASSNLARFDGIKYGLRAPNPESLSDLYKKSRFLGFGPEVKRRIMLGTYVLSSGYYDAFYLKAAKVRTLITRDFDQAFTQCDAVISPVATTPAFKIGEKCDDPLQMYLTDIYTVSANLAGIPGISVPCGKDNGLPVGAQFMAPRWREDTLLGLGYATQILTAG